MQVYCMFFLYKQYITLDNRYILLYTVYVKGDIMKIIINTSLMVPIYEQIVDQTKALIRSGELKENDVLPSVRSLSKELKISSLTVKKAYDTLETEGYTITIHGKGTYVAKVNKELILEEEKKELEAELEKIIQKSRRAGITDTDLKSLFDLMLEG